MVENADVNIPPVYEGLNLKPFGTAADLYSQRLLGQSLQKKI